MFQRRPLNEILVTPATLESRRGTGRCVQRSSILRVGNSNRLVQVLVAGELLDHELGDVGSGDKADFLACLRLYDADAFAFSVCKPGRADDNPIQ